MLTERHFHYLMYSHFRVSTGFQVMHTCTYRAGTGLVFFKQGDVVYRQVILPEHV